MQRAEVTVRWSTGLHLRPASRLVRLARRFRSEIRLRAGNTFADARSILGIMLLCAGAGMSVEVVVDGDDEHDAVCAVQRFFDAGSEGSENPAAD